MLRRRAEAMRGLRAHAVRGRQKDHDDGLPLSLQSRKHSCSSIMSAMVPVAELHLHLKGSVEPDTLLEMDPSLTREEIARETAYTDFEVFIQSYIWVNRKLNTPGCYALPGAGLFQRPRSQACTYA